MAVAPKMAKAVTALVGFIPTEANLSHAVSEPIRRQCLRLNLERFVSKTTSNKAVIRSYVICVVTGLHIQVVVATLITNL